MKEGDKITIILKGESVRWPIKVENEFEKGSPIEVTIVVMKGDKIDSIRFDEIDCNWSVITHEFEIIDDKKTKKKLGRDPIAEVGAEIKALDNLRIAMGFDSYMSGFEIIEEAIKRIKELTRFNEDSVGVIFEKEEKIDYLEKGIVSLKDEIATEKLTKPLQLDFAGQKVTVADLLGTTEFIIETRKFDK